MMYPAIVPFFLIPFHRNKLLLSNTRSTLNQPILFIKKGGTPNAQNTVHLAYCRYTGILYQ